jgi:hypothetical protein
MVPTRAAGRRRRLHRRVPAPRSPAPTGDCHKVSEPGCRSPASRPCPPPRSDTTPHVEPAAASATTQRCRTPMPALPANGMASMPVPGDAHATDGAGDCGRATLYSPIHPGSSNRLTASLTCAPVNKRPALSRDSYPDDLVAVISKEPRDSTPVRYQSPRMVSPETRVAR